VWHPPLNFVHRDDDAYWSREQSQFTRPVRWLARTLCIFVVAMSDTAGVSDAEAARRHIILTEVFGVHPRVIVDALVVSANEHLYIRGSQLEDTVYALLGDTEHADKAAEEGVHSITTLLEHVIDHTMDTFELYCLRSIFVITPEQSQFMTMAHHRGLDLRPAEPAPQEAQSDDSNTVSIVPGLEDQLQRRLACARATQHRLAQAEAASKLRLNRIITAARAFDFILEGARTFCEENDANASGAVTNTADDIMSQVYNVMEALSTLMGAEPLTVSLPPTSHNTINDSEESATVDTRREWEKGRDEYLNWEAQRILASMKRT